MTTKKAQRRRRQIKRVTRRTLQRFVEIVGCDGARAAFDSIQSGAGAEATVRALHPYIDRYVAAHGEEKNTRRDFYRQLEGGAR